LTVVLTLQHHDVHYKELRTMQVRYKIPVKNSLLILFFFSVITITTTRTKRRKKKAVKNHTKISRVD